MEQPKLIFDIGMHKGEDLEFYLSEGAKIVSVDADPLLIEMAKRKFDKYIKSNQLILINKVLSDIDGQELTFNISNNSVWNSLNSGIAGRNDGSVMEIKVQSTTLTALMQVYGVPYYCKIDIEGMDDVCLKSIKTSNVKPEFISVETECLPEKKQATEEDFLSTLYSLKSLGYSRFQLIDQATLQQLVLGKKFYTDNHKLFYYTNRILSKTGIKISPYVYKDKLSHQFNFNFPEGSSGPYGHHLEGKWSNFEEAKKLLIQHRTDYFKLSNAFSFGFWCDWHATI